MREPKLPTPPNLHKKFWLPHPRTAVDEFEWKCESSEFMIWSYMGERVRVARLFKGRRYVHSGSRMAAVRRYFRDRGVKGI